MSRSVAPSPAGGHESEELVCDHRRGGASIESDGAERGHPRLEHLTPFAYRLPPWLATTGWVGSIVRDQPCLLCCLVDVEQERSVEEVDDLVEVRRDATDEQGTGLARQQLFQSGSAPNPAVGSEPLPIGGRWRVGEPHMTARPVLPVGQLGVPVRIDGRVPSARELLGQRRLPRSGIASDEDRRHPEIMVAFARPWARA